MDPKKLRVSYEDDTVKQHEERDGMGNEPKVSTTRMVRISGLYRNWVEISKINFLVEISKINFMSNTMWSRRFSDTSRTSLFLNRVKSLQSLPTYHFKASEKDPFLEKFPVIATTLMNETNLWGCFYIFPEVYGESFSPTVKIRTPEELGETLLSNDVLTRDLIATCLSYLARSPITGDYVYIKLDLSSKHLQDIAALKDYKFIQYLDLSKNLLSDLAILSFLPYVQYLNVAFNRLTDVLDYDTPQWFLTEVHYRYNYVKKIRDMTKFWSITVLDFSHNNIKAISGLQNLRYLRKLDLSFNHIQRLENLSHLRLTWLDISYNNISSYESDHDTGLKTLLHLEYLNMNENQLTSLKIFAGCCGLRELHTRNNRLSTVLELAVYMRKLRCLSILDLRENPVCSESKYRAVVMNTLPNLLRLDDEYIEPVEKATLKIAMTPDVICHASRRLLRLLYIEQLSRTSPSHDVPPGDTCEVPLVVLVGPEAAGKGRLVRRLAAECDTQVRQALIHTTATHHEPHHYRRVSHDQMDDMIVSGELLTYSEMEGDFYGLSRKEAFVSGGKVVVTSMEQLPALMLRLRFRRPYLLLASCSDLCALALRQNERRRQRYRTAEVLSQPTSTLQVLVSERLDIYAILNEILMTIPEDKMTSSFVLASDCSLKASTVQASRANITSSHLDIEKTIASHPELVASPKEVMPKPSLFSLYKSQGNNDPSVEVHWQPSSAQFSLSKSRQPMNTSESTMAEPKVEGAESRRGSAEKPKRMSSDFSRPKSIDVSRYTTSTRKDSTKSVTFLSHQNEATSLAHLGRLTGLLVDIDVAVSNKDVPEYSISKKLSPWLLANQLHSANTDSDRDLWNFLMYDLGLLQPADELQVSSEILREESTQKSYEDKPYTMMMNATSRPHSAVFKDIGSSWKDDCESLHRKCPGLFWDTLNMDDLENAYKKLKRVVKDIVDSQGLLKPMLDIDFHHSDASVVQRRRERIMKDIAPTRFFM